MPNMTMIKFGSTMNNILYRLSGGRLMGQANNLPILLLTTIGRRTGNPHMRPVVYLKHGDHYVIMPGVIERPDWLRNLMANPTATIQIKNQTMNVQATQADEVTRAQIWETVPDYWRDYQAQYNDPLPLMLLTPID